MESVVINRAVNFSDNRLLIDLCGELNCNLRQLESLLSVQIIHRGNELFILGNANAQCCAIWVLRKLYIRLEQGKTVESGDIQGVVRMLSEANPLISTNSEHLSLSTKYEVGDEIHTRKKIVSPRSLQQQNFIRQLLNKDITFAVGPAGTGKTYLAVAMAVSMFIKGRVDKIILSRPAVEAGERLGFLPGDMKDKVDPYMQPLYDALHDFLPQRNLIRLLADKRIEIAPLAFMRGRTLNNAFVMLDEAQNTTTIQMRMILTRLGINSRMVITGDNSQIDLSHGIKSGLVESWTILQGVNGIGFVHFDAQSVMRHPLVGRIIRSYDAKKNQ